MENLTSMTVLRTDSVFKHLCLNGKPIKTIKVYNKDGIVLNILCGYIEFKTVDNSFYNSYFKTLILPFELKRKQKIDFSVKGGFINDGNLYLNADAVEFENLGESKGHEGDFTIQYFTTYSMKLSGTVYEKTLTDETILYTSNYRSEDKPFKAELNTIIENVGNKNLTLEILKDILTKYDLTPKK